MAAEGTSTCGVLRRTVCKSTLLHQHRKRDYMLTVIIELKRYAVLYDCLQAIELAVTHIFRDSLESIC
jgi:hypothetical protein